MKRHHKAPRAPPRPKASSESEPGPLESLPEIHAALERVRGHVAQWLAGRDRMATRVAEFEALTAQSPPVPDAKTDGDKT